MSQAMAKLLSPVSLESAYRLPFATLLEIFMAMAAIWQVMNCRVFVRVPSLQS